MLIQTVLDDLVEHDASLQGYLASKFASETAYILIDVTDLKQRFYLKVNSSRILIKNSMVESDVEWDVTMRSSSLSFWKLSKTEEVNPSVLCDLDVEVTGNIQMVNQLLSYLTKSDYRFVLSRVFSDLISRHVYEFKDSLSWNHEKISEARKKHQDYVKKHPAFKATMEKQFVSEAAFEQFSEEVYQQYKQIQQLERAVQQLKNQLT